MERICNLYISDEHLLVTLSGYLKKEIYPSIFKMQGDRAHCGKGSELLEERDRLVEKKNEAKRFAEEYRASGNLVAMQEQLDEYNRLNTLLYGERS